MEHQIPNKTFYTKKEVEGLGPLAIHDLLFKPEMVQDEVGNMTAKENSWVCKICESQAILSGSQSITGWVSSVKRLARVIYNNMTPY